MSEELIQQLWNQLDTAERECERLQGELLEVGYE